MLKKNLFYFWLLIIIIVNLVPVGTGNINELASGKGWSFRIDYIFHFFGFFILPVFYYLGLKYGKLTHNTRQYIKIILISLFFAVLVEYIQKFLPYRAYNPVDLFYNIMGVIVGFFVFHTFIYKLINSNIVGVFEGDNALSRKDM
ncbi:MAG: VanZ family protein [Candidatus Cloacimonetes bacterium]|nr:VanZ family protein [Candidatus Cloacimonadota bacterium]